MSGSIALDATCDLRHCDDCDDCDCDYDYDDDYYDDYYGQDGDITGGLAWYSNPVPTCVQNSADRLLIKAAMSGNLYNLVMRVFRQRSQPENVPGTCSCL